MTCAADVAAVVTVPELKIVGDVFKWKNVFDTYDADNSGEVDRDELHARLRECSHADVRQHAAVEEVDGRELRARLRERSNADVRQLVAV